MATTVEPTMEAVSPGDHLWLIANYDRIFWRRTYGIRTDEEARQLVIADAEEYRRTAPASR